MCRGKPIRGVCWIFGIEVGQTYTRNRNCTGCSENNTYLATAVTQSLSWIMQRHSMTYILPMEIYIYIYIYIFCSLDEFFSLFSINVFQSQFHWCLHVISSGLEDISYESQKLLKYEQRSFPLFSGMHFTNIPVSYLKPKDRIPSKLFFPAVLSALSLLFQL
jgi:hypothetical protein